VECEPVSRRRAVGGVNHGAVTVGAWARRFPFEPGRKATLRFADGMTDACGFDPGNPPCAGWVGWLGGFAALRRYHELPQWRSIWRQVRLAGVPEGMFSIDQ
jgi:hypothetical protein